MGEGARRSVLGLDTGERTGEEVILPGEEARLGEVQGLSGDGTRTGLDMGRGLMMRTGLEVGESASASSVELVSATLLGVPHLLGLPPLPFSLISLLGEEVGEVRGLERGLPGVSVSELTAELIRGLGEATNVSAEAEVWPPKFTVGTTNLPSLSELSQVSTDDSPSS